MKHMPSKKSQSGFTLIELSIWLIVAGLLVVPAIAAYTNFIEARKVGDHNTDFTNINDKLDAFVVNNGRYPRPANLLAATSDVDYGQETATLFAAMPNCGAWPTPEGVCVTGGATPVLIGAVPFAALGLDARESLDYWGNKYLYAVTGFKTDAGGYVAGGGGVVIRGLEYDPATGITTAGVLPIVGPPLQVDVMLVTHGEEGRGAYTSEGNLISACNSSPGIDQENCDFDEVFEVHENARNPFSYPFIVGATPIPGRFGTGQQNFVPGANYYDDMTFDKTAVEFDNWLQSLASANYALSFAAKIGVGTDDPDLDVKVHVVGDVRANRLLSDELCDDAGNCFNPLLIAGTEPDMDCNQNSIPGEEPVLRIASRQVHCASPVNSGGGTLDGIAFEFPAVFTRTDCGATAQLMTGINATGDPICATP